MKNKIIALALVGVMLSVCFAGVFSYADDADAIVGEGTSKKPYAINTTENPIVLSELKDKAVVYFNLSYDKQYAKSVTPAAKVTTTDGENSNAVTVTNLNKDSDYRFSSVLVAPSFTVAAELKVTYTVTIEYKALSSDTTVATDTVYYVAYVNVLESTKDTTLGSVVIKGNEAYTTSNPLVTVPVIGSGNSYYSNNLPAGLYLETAENGDVKVVGMIGSGLVSDTEKTFDIYQITESDVVKTTVSYTVVGAEEGNGFKYTVSADKQILNETSDDDRTIIVKSGTPLTITTTKNLTQFKAVNQTDGTAYKVITSKSNAYELSNNVSGTVKVFMTYNNGINDNCTKVLTIIYIGSTADASLSNPVVRSY